MKDWDLTENALRPIPQRRIIDKMNEYMGRRDFRGAERHLLYWLEEARLARDEEGLLVVRNELIGHYRKTGQEKKTMESAQEALGLLKELDMEDTISAGTTFVNVATAYEAFGDHESALAMFRRARDVYESSAYTEPRLLGGLYNNMALTCTALGRKLDALAHEQELLGLEMESLGHEQKTRAQHEKAKRRYGEALDLYEKAIEAMANVEDGELEQAISYLNMANTVELRDGMENAESRINALVEKAEELLEAKGQELLGADWDPKTASGDFKGALTADMRARLGYYAFVCEKCAPTFEYYGYFMTAERLNERSDALAALL
ncbi:MAG TPA: hypothetical protein DCF49_10025 [Lachnospiraceae bacterium]|nr:hypothetical protein [Lachnospiraceae bacterium]